VTPLVAIEVARDVRPSVERGPVLAGVLQGVRAMRSLYFQTCAPHAESSAAPTASVESSSVALTAPFHGGCCVKGVARLIGYELSAGFAGGGKGAHRLSQAAAGAVVWRQSLRRLCAVLVSRHSDRAAARLRRKKRSTPRLNLVSANTGSIIPWRLA
jgi:hypothetical protein